MDLATQGKLATIGFSVLVIVGIFIIIVKMYRKAVQGEALVKTGMGGTKISFNGLIVFPVLHKLEIMDITLKTLTIGRTGKEGLVCKDNLRADIKVNFFVRVNKSKEDVVFVAQTIGSKRASNQQALEQLFDAKFSEALKTVGKQFDFVDLYNSRDDFKQKIIETIGTDLNGYILDDCAIDYLEQTSIKEMDESNILDAEGIKKIIDLTSIQKVEANQIQREKEMTIKKQDVEAKETVLELERQLIETEEKKKKEIDTIRARERAETAKVREEEELKSESARIEKEEQLEIANENKMRQVLVAQRNKERTDAVELERVKKDQMLEQTEREKVVAVAEIEKEKIVEEERKNIQDVIRDRVAVEKEVVIEEEKIKDTREISEAERQKTVAIKLAEKDADALMIKTTKAAEADKQSAEFKASTLLIESEAEQKSAGQRAEAMKTIAEAEAAQYASKGMAEATVMTAKANAKRDEGQAEADVIEAQAEAEAKGIQLKSQAQAVADEKLGFTEAKVIAEMAKSKELDGLAEAKVLHEKLAAEAKGVEEKAVAMKKLDGVGKEHEEYKLQIEKEKELSLIHI